jgi:hypothetical protein
MRVVDTVPVARNILGITTNYCCRQEKSFRQFAIRKLRFADIEDILATRCGPVLRV